jgi:aminoglycoside N3'-acetyltransferase
MRGKQELVGQLRASGLRAGDLVMVHTSLRAIGPLAGGPATLLAALLDVLTPEGTLAAFVSWQHSSYDATLGGRRLAGEERDTWPVFDPRDAPPPYDGFGQFNRFLCRHPAVRRSAHPDASFAAIGRQAAALTADHALVDGYGPASPLGRFVGWRGRVLMLGAPPGTITALHLAEAVARIPGKRRVRYEVPLRIDGRRCWREAEEFDTNALLDACLANGLDPIECIATEYVAQGHGRRGRVGAANSWLFEAPDLVAFGVRWLESRFASIR